MSGWLTLVGEYAAWLVAISAASLLLGAVLVPAMIVRIPADYFLHDNRFAVVSRAKHPAVRFGIAAAKNVLGAVLLAAGFAMLFLPGQGLLTLFAGLMVMNYPGKYHFERWLVRRPHVLAAMNWLRARYGRDPLIAP